MKHKVTIIIPCRNEEKFIGMVLDNVIAQDYPKELLEIFVVDGESEDRTKEIIQDYADKYPFIKYLPNPERVVPFALNKAIKMATGSVIVRMDAHAVYPEDYVSELVKGLEKYDCDNTGGAWITKPANDSVKAIAIAEATSHPFGIGNAYYRLDIKNPRQVDTVPFGCYKRKVFDRIGLFDEELVRNQDDEFNARLIKNGGSIFLLPHVKILYFARETFNKMAKMFYQYGLYKPLVNLKIGTPATLRQFVPPLFVLYSAISILAGIFHHPFFYAFFTGIIFYFLASIMVSIGIALNNKNSVALFFHLIWTFPVIHFSYGFGYLSGIFRFLLFQRPIHHSKIEINR
ncbi:MAG: glycosyltransferase family 2 protein [Bacteroidales bacterium]|nr:glycosyltransferase family 2 protein [Bacteroidales bacterium]